MKRALRSAGDLFMEHGYDGVSMQMIVSSTGGSYRDLYRELGDKTRLFRRVVTEICGEVLAPMRAVGHFANESKMSSEDALFEVGRSYLNSLLSSRVLALDRLIISEAARFPELPEIFMTAGPSIAYRDVASLLVSWFAADGIKLDAPAMAARLFLHMIQGDLQLRALVGAAITSREIEAYARAGARIFVAGVRETAISRSSSKVKAALRGL